MKATLWIIAGGLILSLLAGCEKDADNEFITLPETGEDPSTGGDKGGTLPEGYFEVNFSSGLSGVSRAAVTGKDTRVRHLRYMIYKSTGEFVKEKVVINTTDATPSWPLAAVKDTLPRGSYTAVFLANVEKTLFPYNVSGGETVYANVLTNYTSTYADARIVLPTAEFTDTSEYYWAKVPFSDATPQPTIILQRIIASLKLHRNLVDAQTALNQLVNNIVTQVGYKNIISTTAKGILTTQLTNILNANGGNIAFALVGGVDAAVNLIIGVLLQPVTDALYNLLLQQLVNQIGLALTGNADQAGTLAFLGTLLNPWNTNDANTAVVTLNNFPRTMDFNLKVQDVFTGDQRFKYSFTGVGSVYSEKDILIKGFNGLFNVRNINVLKRGLVAGILFDQVVDGPLLLNGTFIDINDPVQATVATNYRYRSDYSFIDLGLKSYTQQTDGNHSLTLSVKLSTIPNLEGLLGGIPVLGPLLGGVIKGLIGNIVVSVPINLPLLGVDNLSLSGGWSTVTTY